MPGAETKSSPLPKNIQPILTEYCYDCHADGANKGKVAFDEFKSHDELGGDAGKILQGIGLGGKTTSTNAPTTNAPSNVLQGIGGLFQKPAKTNAPATKIPPKKNDGLNLNNLLK